MLLDAGIVLLQLTDERVFDLPEGDLVRIDSDRLYWRGQPVSCGRRLDSQAVNRLMGRARRKMPGRLREFVQNTIDFASEEKSLLLETPPVPPLNVRLRGRPALVAVRGRNYRSDLQAIRTYIEEQDPAIIAVDGAADVLLSLGFPPDVLLGDMDSVSDEVLTRCAGRDVEILVHAYPDGRAPGRQRIRRLGVPHRLFPVGGTSEDAALLLADSLGSELIVAVGTHSDPVEFMEKGRAGMASTMLVRLRVGEKLVDAKGVSELYHTEPRPAEVLWLLGAGLIPAAVLLWISPAFNLLFRLLWVHFRTTVGG